MGLRTARPRPDCRPDRRNIRQAGRVAGLLVVVALGIALGGCGAVETYRSLTGVDKNDPDPQTAPFSGNLAAGEALPYPNLASVPPPPVHSTSTTERQKLTQSLFADRAATAAAAGPAAPQPAADAPAPPAVPADLVSAAATANAPAPSAGAATPPASRTALNSAQSGRRSAGEPPEPLPLDSSLQMPDVRSVPEPEATRPPPPVPVLAAVPQPAKPPEPPPAALASAMPQPAPPVPVLAPVAPPPAPLKPAPRSPPAATTVATLGITGDAAGLGGQDRGQIERVAALYKDNPGGVRVLAYATAPTGGGDPLDSYHAALDRAEAVAKALADSGIPASKIQSAAAPAAGASAAGRVEIQFIQ
jgi:hypothetical protein